MYNLFTVKCISFFVSFVRCFIAKNLFSSMRVIKTKAHPFTVLHSPVLCSISNTRTCSNTQLWTRQHDETDQRTKNYDLCDTPNWICFHLMQQNTAAGENKFRLFLLLVSLNETGRVTKRHCKMLLPCSRFLLFSFCRNSNAAVQ
jgi:hypothetical protein